MTRLSYREGTYATVLQRLKTYLTTQRDALIGLPLQLDIYDSQSWAIALLESWSMVIDVLTFYQERIANEGYLSTATELRSIMELVAAIGYGLYPGISASTYLAFTVRNMPGVPSQHYSIPQGVAVQSVPAQGQSGTALPNITQAPDPAQLPQVFETFNDFLAYPSWNAIAPAPSSDAPAQTIYSSDTSLRLAGTNTGIIKGNALLITGEAPAGQEPPWIFALIASVTPNPKKGYTEISWQQAATGSANTPLTNSTAFVLQKSAKLYAYARGGIYFTPVDGDSADCTPSGIGLPNTEVHALILHKSGALLAATDNGVFRSTNNGESWESASSGLMKMKISALTTTTDGKLYAGSTNGGIFYSLDVGDNWYLVINRVGLPAGLSALLSGSNPTNSATTLPRTEIHALATFTQNKLNYLAAALDNGVYLSEDGGHDLATTALKYGGSRRSPGIFRPIPRYRTACWDEYRRLSGRDEQLAQYAIPALPTGRAFIALFACSMRWRSGRVPRSLPVRRRASIARKITRSTGLLCPMGQPNYSARFLSVLM